MCNLRLRFRSKVNTPQCVHLIVSVQLRQFAFLKYKFINVRLALVFLKSQKKIPTHQRYDQEMLGTRDRSTDGRNGVVDAIGAFTLCELAKRTHAIY